MLIASSESSTELGSAPYEFVDAPHLVDESSLGSDQSFEWLYPVGDLIPMDMPGDPWIFADDTQTWEYFHITVDGVSWLCRRPVLVDTPLRSAIFGVLDTLNDLDKAYLVNRGCTVLVGLIPGSAEENNFVNDVVAMLTGLRPSEEETLVSKINGLLERTGSSVLNDDNEPTSIRILAQGFDLLNTAESLYKRGLDSDEDDPGLLVKSETMGREGLLLVEEALALLGIDEALCI